MKTINDKLNSFTFSRAFTDIIDAIGQYRFTRAPQNNVKIVLIERTIRKRILDEFALNA